MVAATGARLLGPPTAKLRAARLAGPMLFARGSTTPGVWTLPALRDKLLVLAGGTKEEGS